MIQSPVMHDRISSKFFVPTSRVLDDLTGFGQALELHCATSSHPYLLRQEITILDRTAGRVSKMSSEH